MNYTDWAKAVPMVIKGDPLWKVEAYRLALYAAEVGWQDATKLMRDKRTLSLADNLYAALGSISAGIAEGFSRADLKERAQGYQRALGSARESRDWYYKARHILGESTTIHRLDLLARIIRLLLAITPGQQEPYFREETAQE